MTPRLIIDLKPDPATGRYAVSLQTADKTICSSLVDIYTVVTDSGRVVLLDPALAWARAELAEIDKPKVADIQPGAVW
jgi:hypothetical protein